MNPLRDRDPNIYHHIAVRTVEARIWMTPTTKMRKLIGGVIARYQELLEIQIFAYCVLGNHLHMVVKAPKSNCDEFYANVNREIARRVNWKCHREGPLWARRYSDQEVLDDEADLLDAFLYVNTNPTRHGLVRDSGTWTGLSSYNHALNEKELTFPFYHYSASDDE